MSWTNKVVWSEGLFLQPQLFQQQERYLEHFAHLRARPLSPFFWGFSHYRLDPESLGLGKLVLSSASGLFIDGTPFSIPGESPPPQPLAVRPEHLDQVVYLALPSRVPNGEETSFGDTDADGGARDDVASLARYGVFETELRDANSIGQGPRPVQLCRQRLRLLPHKELTSAWMGLPLARVTTIRGDGSIELEPDLLPPVNVLGASGQLLEWMSQLHGTARLRAQRLADRLSGAAGQGAEAAEVGEYLTLQLLNRYETELDGLLALKDSPPAALHRLLRSLEAELSTYVRPATRRPSELPRYDHLDPHGSFSPLVEAVRELLNAVLLRSAERIALQSQEHGMHVASVDPSTLAGFQAMVLTVRAQVPLDQLVAQFPAQAKFGPADRLAELVRLHLPALQLSSLPVPPRQIPYAAGTAYFQVESHGHLWNHAARYGGLALHVAVDIPGLVVELWGVRGWPPNPPGRPRPLRNHPP
ncbi:type VI secretion system baseplate subunit TssK [Xylophilus sp. GOD-11R]|uniref:type VI secretion system baseplate subunit TssK n=1 Tax=Xylophilus sp. GOD-11R TaxID=3089814 RepID=UPI00298CF148|nr:type VI secretion system baseplate subunit TssK [Xylophilus sp. GOD-11R]WPB55364.1 type VI secretion system baseplate subunit TssK [Xylophilus sp. GOD-11R]